MGRFGKVLMGGVVLGAAFYATDQFYWRVIEPRLPDPLRPSKNTTTRGWDDVLYLLTIGVGVSTVAVVGSSFLKKFGPTKKIADASPIKAEASLVKAAA